MGYCCRVVLVLVWLLVAAQGNMDNDLQIFTRDQNDLYSFTFLSGIDPAFLKKPDQGPYSLFVDAYDDVTESYIIGRSAYPPGVYIYKKDLINGYVSLNEAGNLVTFTTYKGLLYCLVQNPPVSTYLVTVDLTNTKNITSRTVSLGTYVLKFSVPLVYVPSRGVFYFEVEDQEQVRRTVSMDLQTLHTNDTSWITGSSKFWYYPGCPDLVFGFQKGEMYTINITDAQLKIFFSTSCELTPQYMTIDFNRGLIFTMERCVPVGAPPPRNTFSIWWFNNTKAYEYTESGTFREFIGIQFPTKSARMNASCPVFSTPPVVPTPPSPPSPDVPPAIAFIQTYSLYFIIGLSCAFLIVLIIAIGLFCTNKSHRQGYDKIEDGIPPESMQRTLDLQDTLNATGGRIDASEIELGELIGHGSFANVYRGNFHDTEVAIKVIKFVSLKDMEKSLLEEAGLMVKLRHPHIVLFMGAGIKMPDLFIVTEFMANGSVRELLDKKEVLLEPEHIKKMCIEACKGMAFLHSRKIIHRDLKTHNLLVDKYWSVKVADFGLSRAMGDTDGTMTACGTPSWAAPEVLRRDHYSYKADVYSFGICLWEMNTRKRPYSNLKPYQVVIAVATDGLRPDIEGSIPSYFEKLIRVCWNDVPAERPDFPKLREMFEEVKCPEPKYSNPTYTKAAPDLQGSQSLPNLADKNGGSSKQFN